MSVVADAVVYPLSALAGSPARARMAEGAGAGRHFPAEVYVLCLVVALGSFAYAQPQYTEVEPWRETAQAVIRWDQYSPADRVAMVAYTDEQPTSGPMEAQYMVGDPLQVAGIVGGSGVVETLRHGGASDDVRVRADTPVTLQFYTYDYPGWRVTMDGQVVPHRHEPPYGLVTVDVPVGEHQLELRMGSTPPRVAGGIVSLAAGLLIVVLLVRRGMRRPV
jgi:hypothetical protein